MLRPPGRPSLLAWLLGVSLWALAPSATAKTGSATLIQEVPAGQWKGVRLQHIPEGAELRVAVDSDGPVGVALFTEAEFAGFPAGRPVFRGQTEDTLSFSVKAPETSDYYVLVDNRGGGKTRSVELTIEGESPPAGSADAQAEAQLGRFQRQLGELFVFEPVSMRVRDCGEPKVARVDGGVLLCREYATLLAHRLKDQAKATDALLFTVLHELAHLLLEQWGHPLHANEEAADEFATAVLVMAGYEKRLEAPIEFFEASSSVLGVLVQSFRDDPHPLPRQRARNLQRLREDPELTSRWQAVFVPHMQTKLLEQLRDAPAPWTDPALVSDELRAREVRESVESSAKR